MYQSLWFLSNSQMRNCLHTSVYCLENRESDHQHLTRQTMLCYYELRHDECLRQCVVASYRYKWNWHRYMQMHIRLFLCCKGRSALSS